VTFFTQKIILFNEQYNLCEKGHAFGIFLWQVESKESYFYFVILSQISSAIQNARAKKLKKIS
jgi:hypothetical protein